jgi:hypothetical protein
MKLSIVSFGPNSRIVAKFRTDRFRTFGENRREKKNKESHGWLILIRSVNFYVFCAETQSSVTDSVQVVTIRRPYVKHN